MTIASSSIPELTGEMQPKGVQLTPSDYFVLSRVDGHSTVRELSQVTGQSLDTVIEVLDRLSRGGLVRLPGHAAESAASPPPDEPSSPNEARTVRMPDSAALAAERARLLQMGSPSQRSRRSASGDRPAVGSPDHGSTSSGSAQPRRRSEPNSHARNTGSSSAVGGGALATPEDPLSATILPDGWPVSFDQFVFDPSELSQGEAMSTEHKKVVTYVHYHLKRVTYYDLFGISKEAGRREIRKGYFRMSKAFHPDRWFRKDVGIFGARVEEIFKWVNRANSVLGSPRKRKGYDKLVSRGYIGEWQLEEEQSAGSGGRGPVQRRSNNSGSQEATRGKSSMATQMMKMRARQAQSAGRFSEAADLYRRAVQLDDSAELRIALIECMLKANVDPTEIRAELDAARSKGAGGVRLLILQGEVARRLGDNERARACFETVLEEDPANPVARLGIERLDEVR